MARVDRDKNGYWYVDGHKINIGDGNLSFEEPKEPEGCMQTERGVMVMKDGKAWGTVYADEHLTAYGWIDPVHAPIHNPDFCKKPTDVTYTNSSYIKELSNARLVPVRRETCLIIEKSDGSDQ